MINVYGNALKLQFCNKINRNLSRKINSRIKVTCYIVTTMIVSNCSVIDVLSVMGSLTSLTFQELFRALTWYNKKLMR